MKRMILNSLILTIMGISQPTMAMVALDDEALSIVDGQALLNLENSYDSSQNIKFHKLSVEALMELNVNIKTLQLGCGGVNNSIKTGCDIDISNISLSGLNPSVEASTQSPLFTSDRAATSASITNPFIEFAIKGNSASTREVTGFRLGAEQIMGLLTLGTDNVQNPTDGIKSFSGFMKMAQTAGESLTKEAKFGTTDAEKISGKLEISLLGIKNDRTFTSKPITGTTATEGHNGITVPSMRVNFTMPETIVTGTSINKAVGLCCTNLASKAYSAI